MQAEEIRMLRESLRKLQRTLGWQWKNDASCCGITVAQCHALLEIGKSGELTLVDLASTLGLDNSTLSRTLDSMVKSGLAERQASREDRRYLRIILTRQGKEVYKKINSTYDLFYAEAFSAIPADKHTQVAESISLLAAAIASVNLTDSCRKVRLT